MSATAVQDTFEDSTQGAWAVGISVFAGASMVIVGLFQVVEGIAALLNDKVFVTTPEWVFGFDLTTWGWIHLVVGVLAVIIGGALVFGRTWALVVAITLTAISAVTSFAFIPWAPAWSLSILAIDIAILWSLGAQLGRR